MREARLAGPCAAPRGQSDPGIDRPGGGPRGFPEPGPGSEGVQHRVHPGAVPGAAGSRRALPQLHFWPKAEQGEIFLQLSMCLGVSLTGEWETKTTKGSEMFSNKLGFFSPCAAFVLQRTTNRSAEPGRGGTGKRTWVPSVPGLPLTCRQRPREQSGKGLISELLPLSSASVTSGMTVGCVDMRRSEEVQRQASCSRGLQTSQAAC